MGSVEDLIHSCEHGLDIDGCLDCQYNMSISHLPVIYRPSIEAWYNSCLLYTSPSPRD